jgi:hypothetical protein
LEKKTPIKKIKDDKKKGYFLIEIKNSFTTLFLISLFIKEYQPFSLSIKDKKIFLRTDSLLAVHHDQETFLH